MTADHRLTRRQVLGGAAAAGAASLLGPAAGLAAALQPRRSLGSRLIGSVAGTSAPIEAPFRFSLVGVEWVAVSGSQPSIELRTRRRGGAWGPWAAASSLGHDPDGGGDGAARVGQPVWSGPGDYVQLRTSRLVRGVRIHFVASASDAYGPRVAGGAGLPLATPVLDAGPGQPPIIARVAWARGHAPPSAAPSYGAVKLAFVHHSETPNGYSTADVPAMLMSIYDYHRFVQGWDDIGYNFAVDAFGRIWEARAGGIDQAVIGAQAGGYNAVSTGAVVLGSFMSVPPSSAALAALEQLLAWKLSLHGVPTLGRVTVRVSRSGARFSPFAPGTRVSLPRVAGHRDGDSTNCPGNALYGLLPDVRSRVSALAGEPLQIMMTASPPTVVAGATVGLAGRLTRLSGAPVAGEPVEIQRVTPGAAVTLLEVATAADGSFAAQLTLTQSAVLGALHRPAPAAVAAPAHVGVLPLVSLSVVSGSPLQVAGSVSPPKPTVTVELYAGTSRRLVRRKRVRVFAGRFTATLRPPKPGSYAVSAVTAADAHNAAGSSPLVAVTV
jgi:hypothetical protein